MSKALRVAVVQSLDELSEVVSSNRLGELASSGQEVKDFTAASELQDGKEYPFIRDCLLLSVAVWSGENAVLSQLVDVHHVGVVQSLEDLGLSEDGLDIVSLVT